MRKGTLLARVRGPSRQGYGDPHAKGRGTLMARVGRPSPWRSLDPCVDAHRVRLRGGIRVATGVVGSLVGLRY